METIELMGYLVFTIAAAGLMIGFLYSINFFEVQNTMASIITPQEDTSKLQKVNYVELIKRIESCETKCNSTEERLDCGNLLLTEDLIEEPYLTDGLGRSFFEEKFSKLNYCADCNIDLLGVIMPNTVVNLQCNENNGWRVKLSGTFNAPSDIIAPTTTISGCPSGWNNSSKTITLKCLDPYPSSGCKETKYSINGAEAKKGTEFTLERPIDADKNYEIKYFSTDNNNQSETEKVYYCAIRKETVIGGVDDTPPVTSFSGCENIWNNSSKEISISCADEGSGCSQNAIKYRFYRVGKTPSSWINGGAVSATFTIEQTELSDINYQIDFYSTDSAGNVEEINTRFCPIRRTFVACFSKGGSGAGLDPYKISTCFDLNCIREKTGDNNYILVNDIDCSDTINWNYGEGFKPLPPLGKNINGNYDRESTFDGANFKIKNLFINYQENKDYVGLFSENYGIITRTNLENITIKNNFSNAQIGGFAGNNSYGQITYCSLTGKIYDYGYYIGGIVGSNAQGTLDSITTDINFIKRTDYQGTYYPQNIGGIAGQNNGTIKNITAKINFDTNTQISALGGITGNNNSSGVIKNSNINLVLGSIYTSYFGGITGQNNGTIKNITAKINQNALKNTAYYFGGITGQNSSSSSIEGAKADLNITQQEVIQNPWTYFGGITGENYGTIKNSASNINLVQNKGQMYYFGGVTGQNYGIISQSKTTLNLIIGSQMYIYYFSGMTGYLVNKGSIKNSYAEGKIQFLGSTNSGAGFVSTFNSPEWSIQNCYSKMEGTFANNYDGFINKTSTPSNDSNYSFWDINVSPVKISKGGISKSTLEMKTKSTFTDANWSESIWSICDGNYPSLIWEDKSCDGSPAPIFTVEGHNAQTTPYPQKVEVNCTAPNGCDTLEYQSAQGILLEGIYTFFIKPTTADVNKVMTFKATDPFGNTQSKTIYSAVATQNFEKSSYNMPYISVNTYGKLNLLNNKQGYSLQNYTFSSYYSGWSLSSITQPNSCEFMIDDSDVWFKGIESNSSYCSTPNLNIKEENSLDFNMKFRTKDFSGKYIESQTLKVTINTTGAGNMNTTNIP